MRIVFQGRQRGCSEVLHKAYVDWPAVPQIGHRFVLPTDWTNAGLFGRIVEVTWIPFTGLATGADSQSVVVVDVEIEQ